MKDLIQKYRAMSYEDRLIVRASLGLCFSAALTSGKFLIGLFTDVNLCIIAVYTCAILLAKLQCIRGVTHPSQKRVILTSALLFFASVIYSAFMGSMAFVGRSHGKYGISHVVLLAAIAFFELFFAIRGMFRTRNGAYQYFDIKVIDFCIALIALLTAQIAILDFTVTARVDVYNSFAGMGVGIAIAVAASYILIAPRVQLAGRERQTFLLKEAQKNTLIDMKKATVTLMLCRSKVYGSYVYEATVTGSFVDGKIVQTAGLWRRMNLFWKIVCCILSEILIFAWLIGTAVYFLRSTNLPKRLQRRMAENGFARVETDVRR